MAYDYNKAKEQYEKLNDQQKQQFANDNSGQVQDFLKQYNAEMNNNQQQTSNESNFNNQNGTNGGNFTNNQTNTRQLKGDNLNSNLTTEYVDDKGGWRSMNYDDRKKEYENMDEAGKKGYSNFLNSQSDDYWGRGFMDTYSEENGLDTSKFQQDPGKITVQEGTAQQTGKPDYQANSEARLNEMKGNLDHYFATSPRMFSDRETFNRVFEYNTRESDAQRQLLDSYWKRKEDMDKASQYTSGESIMNGLKNSQITTDQLNLIKENDQEAYRKWQQLQEEEIKKRIVNDIVPPLMSDIANQINDMINMLGIQAQDALDIEGIYNDTMDRTGAYQTLEDANRTVKEIEAITNKKTAIMNRYAASTGGTVSDALAAARMQKAIAPYNEQLQGLQYQYQDYSNLYSQKQATALQAANVRALQANENQRIWNQRCQALGFAMDAMSYRTPEQEKQLALQYQQAQNEMELLQESRLKDLARYDAYATAKLNNQLQQELTDLSVEDENQLKANLNNALSDYYKNYGDIIQRSQAQAVEDIIKYAKNKGISVAQAMTENFIKPLQNKAEYKQKVATDYQMLSKQSIGTINGRNVIMTTNPNGSISYQFIDDPDTTTTSTAKPYDLVDEKVFDTSPVSHSYYTLADFMADKKTDGTQWGGQCAKFVNDYLENIGVGRYFGNEDIKTRESWCNSDTAKVGTIAVFDYGHTSSDGINHGHVGIVVDADDKGFYVLDSNYDVNNPEKIKKRYIPYGSSSLKGFFDPSQPPRTSNTGTISVGGLTDSQLEDLAKKYIDGDKSYQDIKATYGESVLKAVGLMASQMGYGYEKSIEESDIVTDNDIYNYNDSTLNRKMTKEQREKVLKARNEVYSDPNSSMEEILRFSVGGKTPTDSTVQSLDKYAQALTSLSQLNDLLKDADTGPIIGALRSKNPYDKKAREINTAIAGLLPTLARGVYGEVGVLTDKDIEHYSQTVPNLKSTSDVNEAILAMSLDLLADGYKRKLATQASLGYDVSGMQGIYQQIINKAEALKAGIGMNSSASGPTDQINEIYSSAQNGSTELSYRGYSRADISSLVHNK